MTKAKSNDQPKTITLEEANARTEKAIAQRLKNKEAKIAEKEREIAESKKRIAELESLKAELEKQAEQSPEKQLEKMQAEHDEQVAALQAEIEQVNAKREAIEKETAATKKQSALAGALSRYAKIDGDDERKTAVKLFEDHIEMNEQGQPKFRTNDGELVDVDTGIKSSLPDFLRPVSPRSGSGGRDGVVKPRKKLTELERAERELQTLRQECLQAGSPAHLLTQVTRQKRQVQHLQERQRRFSR